MLGGVFSLAAWRQLLADRVRAVAIRFAFVLVAIVFAGVALLLLVGTAVILLTDEFGLPAATAVVAGGAIIVSLLLALLALRRRPAPRGPAEAAPPAAALGDTAAELARLARKHPAETLLAAFAIGVTLSLKPDAVRALADIAAARPRRSDASGTP